MQNYLKYYWLEKDYLEKEVASDFKIKGHLTPKQFFSIIIWKSNYNKVSIKEGLLANGGLLDKAVYDLTNSIFKASTKEEKLGIMLGQPGFQLAMASAVLTILYPDDFSVYDFRVRSQLKDSHNSTKQYPDISYARDKTGRYFNEYIPQVLQEGHKISGNRNLSLRDCDRLLWAKSWYEDLQKFLKDTDTAKTCFCDNPDCAKCLAVNCKDTDCKTHIQHKKNRWKQRIGKVSVDNSG